MSAAAMRTAPMRTARIPIFAVLLIVIAGCASDPDPYCAEYVGEGGPGPGVALCRDLHEQPVCDEPPETARFERDGSMATELVGGVYAICDDALQVVCADRTVVPRCLSELEE